MAITWTTNHYAGTGVSGDCRLFINYNSWVAGNQVPFIQFSLSGETLNSSASKAVLNDTEYSCYIQSMGGGVWKLWFRYTENPSWSGYNANDTALVKAKVVTNLNTYNSGEGVWLVLGKATNPNPADLAINISINTVSLLFDHPYHKSTTYPFAGILKRGVTTVKYDSTVEAGTFDISSVIPLLLDIVYTWRIDTSTDGGAILGDTWTFTTGAALPEKPINPTPVNNATEIDFTGFTLSWEDGGDADTYDVYIGKTGDLTLVSSAQAGISYISDLDEVEEIFEVSPINQKIYWRIDATNDSGTTTGDEWNFDARPAKVSVTDPLTNATGITLSSTTGSWDSPSANTTSYDVYYGTLSGFLSLVGNTEDLYLPLVETSFPNYGDIYYWRVDAVNDFGKTQGDELNFTTIVFYPPRPKPWPGPGPDPDPDPRPGPDPNPDSPNFISTKKSLIGVANNRIWICDDI